MNKKKEITSLEEILITDNNEGVIGYEVNALNDYMQHIGKEKEWHKWYAGSTGMIHKGMFIVYPWDVETFLGGKENTD